MVEIACRRCGAHTSSLEQAPLPGKWGAAVVAHTCQDCWQAWVEEQTRLINHERWLPSEAEHRQVLYQKMADFLKLEAQA